jgi:hypothetical protein
MQWKPCIRCNHENFFKKNILKFQKNLKLGMSVDEIERHMQTKIQVQTHCILKDTKREKS